MTLKLRRHALAALLALAAADHASAAFVTLDDGRWRFSGGGAFFTENGPGNLGLFNLFWNSTLDYGPGGTAATAAPRLLSDGTYSIAIRGQNGTGTSGTSTLALGFAELAPQFNPSVPAVDSQYDMLIVAGGGPTMLQIGNALVTLSNFNVSFPGTDLIGRNVQGPSEGADWSGTFNLTVQDVPEPGSIALIGAALGAFGLSRRRKKK